MTNQKIRKLFGKLALAIVTLENAVEARGRIRWQRDDDWQPEGLTYAEANAKVSAAYDGLWQEVIDLAVSGDVGIAIARQLKRSGPRLVVTAAESGRPS